MKFKITTAVILLLFSGSIIAQKLEQAPINDEFKKFIESGAKRDITGIIPSPTTYIFSDKVSEKILDAKSGFPSSFNLNDEGFVSSVKNQGVAGHCWSFAAIGSLESRSMVLGFGELNLSEHNMATCHGFEWEQGGNQDIATAYLSRLQGPLLESQDIYNDYEFTCSASGLDPHYYVPESRFLPSNPDVVKYYLMNYGAIAVSYYANDVYFNNSDDTYFYSGTDNINHGVLLVGWDDTKSTAVGLGTWIIKNSWGTSWGDNGYFYMSYKDTYAINNPTIYPIRKELNNIDEIFMIDDFGEITSYGFKDEKDYGLIKYNVTENYTFTKIGTFVGASNSLIDIEVFQTKNGDNLVDTLAKKYNILVENPGYYTFDVPFEVNGDFYIKIGYYTPGDKYPIPAEIYYEGYALANIESGVCWISDEGTEWEAVGDGETSEIDLCIRAYGTTNSLQANFSADYKTVCPNSNVTYTSSSVGTITSFAWDFGEGATPATAVGEGPHTVSYSTEGYKNVTLEIEDGSANTDELINYDIVKVNNSIDVVIPEDTIFISEGETIDIYAFGAYSYIWQPSLEITGSNTDSMITVTPDSDITYIVEGTMGTCTSKDSVRVAIVYPPGNDNVCDAIEIPLDIKSGPYTNAEATVEENEPFPSLTSCTGALQWCNEGGLQNSIWFKFVAPETKAVEIETDGFDNQIAVYEAATCEDIVSGNSENYELIAANDDYKDADFSATIVATPALIEGKTYWIQMDGSAQGAEGVCTITITETWPLGFNKVKNNKAIKVYPNPSKGAFKIDLSAINDINDNTNIDILSVDGSIIFSRKGALNQNEYEFSIDRSGMYIVRVTTSSNQYSLPVIIK